MHIVTIETVNRSTKEVISSEEKQFYSIYNAESLIRRLEMDEEAHKGTSRPPVTKVIGRLTRNAIAA